MPPSKKWLGRPVYRIADTQDWLLGFKHNPEQPRKEAKYLVQKGYDPSQHTFMLPLDLFEK